MRFFLFDKYLYANCSAERIVELNRKKTVEKQEKIRKIRRKQNIGDYETKDKQFTCSMCKWGKPKKDT